MGKKSGGEMVLFVGDFFDTAATMYRTMKWITTKMNY